MNSIYNDDSLTLHTDLYQINMMKTYWETGVYEKKAIFEAYFRKLPLKWICDFCWTRTHRSLH